MSFYSQILRPLLFRLDPELAHAFAAKGLRYCPAGLLPKVPAQPCSVMGLSFNNPVGLSAGIDKSACFIDAFSKLGAGFIEVGGVTPSPQPGNPKPRLFRLPAVQGIINRLNFNNPGLAIVAENLAKRKTHIPVGVNICKDDATPIEQAGNDYVLCLERLYPLVDYVSINISCPNTPGLQQLQFGDALKGLLTLLKSKQAALHARYRRYVPLVVKVSPDLDEQEVETLANAFLEFDIDGVIATNSSRARSAAVLATAHGNEQGGLSGAPLLLQANKVLTQFSQVLGGKIPLIGTGGIFSAADAQAKYAAGASLVQLYSGLIYVGPDLIRQAVRSSA